MNEEYSQEVAEALEDEEDGESFQELTPSQYMLSDRVKMLGSTMRKAPGHPAAPRETAE